MKKILLVVAILILTSCGVIPSAYRGNFADTSGNKLDLNATNGVLTLADGRSFESKAFDLKFEDLLLGKVGIYVSTNPTYDNYLEVYWVMPKLDTKQVEENFAWFGAEIIYTMFDLNFKKKEVNSIELMHCDNGTVLLDLPTKRWQIGCPANPKEYNLLREKKN